jgi:hypothetical protein
MIEVEFSAGDKCVRDVERLKEMQFQAAYCDQTSQEPVVVQAIGKPEELPTQHSITGSKEKVDPKMLRKMIKDFPGFLRK